MLKDFIGIILHLVIEKNVVVDEFEETYVVRFFFPREIQHYLRKMDSHF